MTTDALILVLEALVVYGLVLWTHALRHRFGLAYYYALLGALTAVMSWVTDAGAVVSVGGLTFVVGSTVFYTALLLGVFVVYVFDGPPATRTAISIVAGVSILVPVTAAVLHLQMGASPGAGELPIPVPSLRINTASVIATVADLLFLAIGWELLGKPRLRLNMSLRAFLTLLGVMSLDVLLFATGAFAGTPAYFNILSGTLTSRFIVALVAWPLLVAYLNWQNRVTRTTVENRPVFAILSEFARVRDALDHAQREIERRRQVELEKEAVIAELQQALAQVKRLEGLLPMCSGCGRIRTESEDPRSPDRWVMLEDYIRQSTAVRFSHGLCMDCMRDAYPDLPESVIADAGRSRM